MRDAATKKPTWPELTSRERTVMQPGRGVSVGRPHCSQDRAQAESVPANPERSTHQFANAEHQGVSSWDAIGALNVVDCRYSMIRGLSPLPTISRTPTSAAAIACQGKSEAGALDGTGWRYFWATQPVVRPDRTLSQ